MKLTPTGDDTMWADKFCIKIRLAEDVAANINCLFNLNIDFNIALALCSDIGKSPFQGMLNKFITKITKSKFNTKPWKQCDNYVGKR